MTRNSKYKIDKKAKVNIFFYSDPHFGHAAVLDFCKRPFKSVEHMIESFIVLWNDTVGKNDVTYIIGDVFFYLSEAQRKSIINRLNGRKILIKGNHDSGPSLSSFYNYGFHAVVEDAELFISKERVKLSHYPYRHTRWIRIKKWLKGYRKRDKHFHKRPVDIGLFLLHGHTHSKVRIKDRMIHVGVDAWDYKPVPIEKIIALMNKIKTQEKKGKLKYTIFFGRLRKRLRKLFKHANRPYIPRGDYKMLPRRHSSNIKRYRK